MSCPKSAGPGGEALGPADHRHPGKGFDLGRLAQAPHLLQRALEAHLDDDHERRERRLLDLARLRVLVSVDAPMRRGWEDEDGPRRCGRLLDVLLVGLAEGSALLVRVAVDGLRPLGLRVEVLA